VSTALARLMAIAIKLLIASKYFPLDRIASDTQFSSLKCHTKFVQQLTTKKPLADLRLLESEK
jgi:hypothetical protein